MPGFRRDATGRALIGDLALAEVLAHPGVTTPTYVYDLDAIRDEGARLVAAFGDAPHVVAYAVKANSAGSVLRALTSVGVGADVVSGAELRLALAAGAPPRSIVMSGVGKTRGEIDAAVAADLRALQAESGEELTRVADRARGLGRRARVAIRINPGIELDTHAHIATGHDEAKFGVPLAELGAALELIDARAADLELVGLSTHVGSMVPTPAPWLDAARSVCAAARARRAAGHRLEYVDFGGGFGIDYGARPVAPPADFARAALALLVEEGLADLTLVVEPGRALVAAHGVLVARVLQQKRAGERRWLIIDAGMNDLIRPALYAAHHRVEPLDRAPGSETWRVVGPVCESADDFGTHALGAAPEAVVIRDAGAYGFTMASEYNGRGLAGEVFVAGGRVARVAPPSADWVARRLQA